MLGKNIGKKNENWRAVQIILVKIEYKPKDTVHIRCWSIRLVIETYGSCYKAISRLNTTEEKEVLPHRII